MSPLVSVVTIFLNAGPYLDEAITSVVAQSDPRWELVLVDDGSTDGSTAIARAWAARLPGRVRYVEHPGHANRGMSASRNAGVRAARGAYVALLDADDVWLPNKLERQVEILEAHPAAAMTYGPSQTWYSWTGRAADLLRDRVPRLGLAAEQTYAPPTLLLRCHPLGPAATACPSSFFFRRALWERVGGFEESFTGIHALYEDQAFLAKVHLTETVYVAEGPLERYRQHPASCVAQVTRAGQTAIVHAHFLDWLAAYLARARVSDPAILRALETARTAPRRAALARARAWWRRATRMARRRAGAARRRLLGRRPADVGALRRLAAMPRPAGPRADRTVARYYTEDFLARHAADARGAVLRDEETPETAVVPRSFDCIVLTRALHRAVDPADVARAAWRALRPGGVLLATLPGVSHPGDEGAATFLRFTALSAAELFGRIFPPSCVFVDAYGNALAATAAIHGAGTAHLTPADLHHRDPLYQTLVTVRAVKPG